MPALSVLKARIADELHRSDLTSQIAYAIGDAIALYQSKRFRFNEARATLTTVASQEWYAAGSDPDDIPEDVASIDSVRLTINGRDVVLEAWTAGRIEEVATTTNTVSSPWAWAWYRDQIRLYPIPDAAYTLTISYVKKIDAPTSDGSSNAWTNEGASLIRHTAKRMLASEYMQDVDNAAVYAASEKAELSRLLSDGKRLNSGGLRANW